MTYWKYIKNTRNMTKFVTSIHAIVPGVEAIINCTTLYTQGTILPSLLQSRVKFCQWLIKENREFWLKPRLWESGHRRETGLNQQPWSFCNPKLNVFLYFHIGIPIKSQMQELLICGHFILNDGQSQAPSFDPVWSHTHTHTHCTLDACIHTFRPDI